MGSKSVCGHQNDVERGEKRAEDVSGTSLEPFKANREVSEAHLCDSTAFLEHFGWPKGKNSTWPAAGAGPLEVFDFEF